MIDEATLGEAKRGDLSDNVVILNWRKSSCYASNAVAKKRSW